MSWILHPSSTKQNIFHEMQVVVVFPICITWMEAWYPSWNSFLTAPVRLLQAVTSAGILSWKQQNILYWHDCFPFPRYLLHGWRLMTAMNGIVGQQDPCEYLGWLTRKKFKQELRYKRGEIKLIDWLCVLHFRGKTGSWTWHATVTFHNAIVSGMATML